MAFISGSINGVMIDLAPSAIGIGVNQQLVDGLSHCIRTNVDMGYPLQTIQNAFESFPGRRENFGPYLNNKSGQPFSVGGHHDHIHLSVD